MCTYFDKTRLIIKFDMSSRFASSVIMFAMYEMPLNVVITRCNVPHKYIQHRCGFDIIMKANHISYFQLMVKLRGVHGQYFGQRLPCYNETSRDYKPQIQFLTWTPSVTEAEWLLAGLIRHQKWRHTQFLGGNVNNEISQFYNNLL